MIHQLDWCPRGWTDTLDCICGAVSKPYFVTMRDNKTGETRKIKYDWAWEEGSDYLWDEGNWSCDCNRDLDFKDDKGLEREHDSDVKDGYCLGEGRYDVLEIRLQGGQLVYFEKTTKERDR